MSVEERLAIIETKFEERWNAHDKRSSEIWGYIKGELHKLTDSKVVVERTKNTQFRKNGIWLIRTLYASIIGTMWYLVWGR